MPNAPAATKTPVTIGTVLDFADTLVNTPAKVARRERAMERAYAAGHGACELCGKAIVGAPAVEIDDEDSGGIIWIGPTCAVKMRKAGFDI